MTHPVLGWILVAALVLLLQGRCSSAQEHYYQKYYRHMFATIDTGWRDRECLLTVEGREYIGTLKTPDVGREHLQCLPWESVAKKVAKYNPDSLIADQFFPGKETSVNNKYCRNPGGLWSQPGCFLQYPKNRQEEKRKAASCGVPFCPVLTQFRSNPAGLEYGGLDLRSQTDCLDKCWFRHSLLGPACTLSFVGETKKWEVYYPCDVPLMDGETLNLQADIKGAPEGWNIFTPVTWYLMPSKLIDLREGAVGPMFLRLPQDISFEGMETSIKFHIRLGDPKDVNDFEFKIFLSPDTSFLESVVIAISVHGIELVHKINKTYKAPKDLTKMVKIRSEAPWATLMYRWVDLEVSITNKSVKVEVSRGQNKLFSIDALQIFTDNPYIQAPRYVHMASRSGTTLAAIESFNGYWFGCTEGIVKYTENSIEYYQWAVLPKVEPPSHAVPTLNRVPHLNYTTFSDRKLRIQVFNAPFSLWLSSAPIMPFDIEYENSDLSWRKLNVVQIMVGITKIVVIRCGVLKSMDKNKDIVTCKPDSMQRFTTDLKTKIDRGQEVVVDVTASEKSGKESHLVVRVELHVNKREEYTYTLSHPVFPRYWSLVKTKHPDAFPEVFFFSWRVRNLYFRILNSRCKRTQSFLQAEGCIAQDLTKYRIKKIYRHYLVRKIFIKRFWSTPKSFEDVQLSTTIIMNTLQKIDLFNRGPMFEQSFGKSCLSWAAFATTEEEMAMVKKLGNQCFYYADFEIPFCLVDLEGRRGSCEVDRCSQNTMPCFDRADVVPKLPYARDHCIDGNEVMVINLASSPSPANPTYLIFDRKYDFEIKAWNSSLGDLSLCVYLYSWNGLEVTFKIGPKLLIQNLEGAYDHKSTTEDTFLVPWRYTPYTLLDAKGTWTLYLQEYAPPLLTYYTPHILTRIGFDSCGTLSLKKMKNLIPTFVLVKLRPQNKTPTLSHYFETSYFSTPETAIKMSSLAWKYNMKYNLKHLLEGHNTFFRVVGNHFKVWVKGHVNPSRKNTGGIVLFLMDGFTPAMSRKIIIYIKRHRLYIMETDASGNGKEKMSYTNIKKTMFPHYQVEVEVKISYTYNSVKIETIYSAVNSRRKKKISLTVDKFYILYAALTSFNTTRVHWSMGDKMPFEDPMQKPVNGGWSKWVLKSCSKPCGGGFGVMERLCTNPTPSLMGRDCVGPHQTKRLCNTRQCGRLSEELEKDIRGRIIKIHRFKSVQPFSTVRMKCARDLFNRVAFEYPDVVFFWQHHTGRFFQNSSSLELAIKKKLSKIKLDWLVNHVYNQDNVMVIDAAVKELTGLWLFVAETMEGVLTVVYVVPLAVEDKTRASSEAVIEGKEALLSCNARGLSKLTGGNIRQVWLLEGVEYHRVDNVDSTRNDILLIPEATSQHEGMWQCMNTHMKTGIQYKTAVIRLRLLSVWAKTDPGGWTGALNTLMLVGVAAFIVCFYNALVACGAILLTCRNRTLQRQLKKLNKKYARTQAAWYELNKTKSEDMPPGVGHFRRSPSTAVPTATRGAKHTDARNLFRHRHPQPSVSDLTDASH